MKPPITGMATPEQMRELWNQVLTGILGKVSSPTVSAEILQTARGFLNDSSYVNPRASEASIQRQLARLNRLYVDGLVAALGSGVPSAGLLEEARLYSLQLERQQPPKGVSSHPEAITINIPFLL